MNAKRALGRYGEELAARRLVDTGMVVLARNWRCGRIGEIDIVARDGDTVVICEVKTRRGGQSRRCDGSGGPPRARRTGPSGGDAFQHPMASITTTKADRLRRLAECWLHRSAEPPPPGGVRIDLVGVLLPRCGAAQVEHVRGVA
ncbi:YraN family protein [Streptomyces sp. SCSIO 30461]|uniref:YraN family protein n=1 Tax=Streptomyces sp. SCSIO 30461 TaxID=3118085 RepID=UPI0030D39F12